jgi:hypothetical protein
MSEERVHLRVYPEEKATIRERAGGHGLSISEYLRRLVVAEERQGLRGVVYPQEKVRTIDDG